MVTVLLLAGCGHPAERAATPSAAAPARHIDPGGIRRIRRDLPPGYEAASLTKSSAPHHLWGLGDSRVAKPERCAQLADPAGGEGRQVQGISGSGAGGTVYATVVAVRDAPVSLPPGLVEQCQRWTMTDGRANARIRLVDAPHIDDAETVGMTANIAISVEGGNEIASQATTFTAYLGDYYASTTLISDPGSAQPALPQQFVADLLVKTVSAVRG